MGWRFWHRLSMKCTTRSAVSPTLSLLILYLHFLTAGNFGGTESRKMSTTLELWRVLSVQNLQKDVLLHKPMFQNMIHICCSLPTCSLPGVWLMLAFITRKSNLVPLLEGLCSSNPCRFELSVFWVFAGIEPTTSGLTVPRSDQLS